MTIIGCGSLGSAILQRVLEAGEEQQLIRPSDSCNELPRRFLACVRTAESASRLKNRFAAYVVADDIAKPQKQEQRARSVQVLFGPGRNVEAVRQSTVVILGCQPSQVAAVVAEEGMADALRGKLVLNICAGITDTVLWDLICRQSPSGAAAVDRRRDEYYFVHAMPNPASCVGQSETILSPRPADFPLRYNAITDWVFRCIGNVTELPPELMAAGTVTAGCAMGFLVPVLQGITTGAKAAGLDGDVALRMAAQAIKGAAEMVLAQGKTPDDLVREVATPGGCTARGLAVLADEQRTGNVAMAFEVAVKEAVARIFELEAAFNVAGSEV
ncbi:pyrroline-5-carboxylate reductase [Apiospora marii]|uniref:pyrroline-5-carboxylate reductase n=1 Tax=Apiospora marii TaxID=335849 RepID=UPI00312EC303